MFDNFNMDEHYANELFECAVKLAYSIFTDPCDDHVMEIYYRLIWSHQHGLGEAGIGTLH